MDDLLKAPDEAIIFSDEKLYVCLASYPLTKGHTIVAWKERVTDLNLLARADYEHLMGVVDIVRNALIKKYAVDKVYLLYLDETKHVHWHLVPRYAEKGFSVFNHSAIEVKSFRDATDLHNVFSQMEKNYNDK